MTIAIANAPCSYGAFENTIGIDPNVPEPLPLLDGVAQAGYSGIDLGPVGYLGEDQELAERLTSRGLALAGGYLALPLSDPAALAEEVERIDALLDVLDLLAEASDAAGVSGAGAPPARPTLADAGSPARFANPGRAASEPELGLDDAGWRRFAEGLARVVERCRARGHEPTFHHHTATYVEAVWEIEKVLELSDVGLCLDTGHLIVGGGEPLTAIGDWSGRINHLHVKDVRAGVVEGIVAERAPFEEIWARRAFCVLGQGDIDLPAVIERVKDSGYAGWLVVEQDIFPDPADPDRCFSDQRANRAFLHEHGL
jgi:inosose dehydratase